MIHLATLYDKTLKDKTKTYSTQLGKQIANIYYL